MEIRDIITAEEQSDNQHLCSQAFHRGNRPDIEDNGWIDPTEGNGFTCGVFDSGSLQAVVTIFGFHVHLGPEAIVPEGTVLAVACTPTSRGKGYAGACLKHTLQRMRERGHVVSFLGPFSQAYYRRLGWEWVGHQRRYTVPTRILRADRETTYVRTATMADRPQIVAAYSRFAGRYRGMLARTTNGWGLLLDNTNTQFTYTYLYERDGQVEGYLTYRGGEQEKTELNEFIALTPRSQRGLLGLLHRHDMQTERFVWNAPDDDIFWMQSDQDDIVTGLSQVTMGRVVDLVGAFQGWKPSPAACGSVVLNVQDECAPWNSGIWKAEFESGNVSVRPTHEAAQVTLDIQALSQAFFGTPTVASLRAAEHLKVHEEAGYQAFHALCDGPPMWLNDHY